MKKVKKWKMKEGVKPVTLFSGKVIKSGEEFEASQEDIPNGFSKLFIAQGDVEVCVKKTAKPVEIKRIVEIDSKQQVEEKIEEKPIYTMEHVTSGYYNIFDPQGKKINKKLVRGNKAKAQIDELNAK